MTMEIDGIDVKAALERLQVSVEIYKKSLASFAESYADIIAKIKKTLTENNITEARDLLHTLRGSAVNIGAGQVETTAEKLGDAVKAGKKDLKPFIHDLETALNIVLDAIHTIPTSDSNGDTNNGR